MKLLVNNIVALEESRLQLENEYLHEKSYFGVIIFVGLRLRANVVDVLRKHEVPFELIEKILEEVIRE